MTIISIQNVHQVAKKMKDCLRTDGFDVKQTDLLKALSSGLGYGTLNEMEVAIGKVNHQKHNEFKKNGQHTKHNNVLKKTFPSIIDCSTFLTKRPYLKYVVQKDSDFDPEIGRVPINTEWFLSTNLIDAYKVALDWDERATIIYNPYSAEEAKEYDAEGEWLLEGYDDLELNVESAMPSTTDEKDVEIAMLESIIEDDMSDLFHVEREKIVIENEKSYFCDTIAEEIGVLLVSVAKNELSIDAIIKKYSKYISLDELTYMLAMTDESEGSVNAMKTLHRIGVNIDHFSVINAAMVCGNINIVDYIASFGVDIGQIVNKENENFLHALADRRNNYVNSHLRNTWKINMFLIHGEQEEYYENIEQQALKMCSKYKIDFNKNNEDGQSPIHIAAASRHYRFIDILLKYGAEMTIKNTHGETAKQILESAEKSSAEFFESIFPPGFH